MHTSDPGDRCFLHAEPRDSPIPFALAQVAIVLFLAWAFLELDDVYVGAFLEGVFDIVARGFETYAAP